jgi:type VI secretion system FHA domain protein
MTVHIRVVGPQLDDTRALLSGQPELVLGRGKDCGLRLPDPDRGISRRHLALSVRGEGLSFKVLSGINPVQVGGIEVLPGQTGQLAPSDALQLGNYTVFVLSPQQQAEATPQPARSGGAWRALDEVWAETVQAVEAHSQSFPDTEYADSVQASADLSLMDGALDDDPFADWTPGQTASLFSADPAHTAAVEHSDDWRAFLQGVGINPAKLGGLSQRELEAVGQRIGRVLEVLMAKAAADPIRDSHLDRTRVAPNAINPLKTNWALETKLMYLFCGEVAGAAFLKPELALEQVLDDQQAHDQAAKLAARAAVAGVLHDFEPHKLKAGLLKGKPKITQLLDAARLWDLYTAYYEKHSKDLPNWLERLFDKHYTRAYRQEFERQKRRP